MADTARVRCPNCGTLNRVAVAASGVPRCGSCHAHLPWLVDATSASFDEAIGASVPVLVDFWAAWCGPCQTVSPVVERLAGELAGRLKVVKLDIDANGDVAERFAIRSIPQLVLFGNGQEVDRVVGAVPEPHLRRWVDERIGTAAQAAASSES